MGVGIEGLPKIKVDQAIHLFVEVYQVGEAWWLLSASMLTTPDEFPIVCVSGNVFRY